MISFKKSEKEFINSFTNSNTKDINARIKLLEYVKETLVGNYLVELHDRNPDILNDIEFDTKTNFLNVILKNNTENIDLNEYGIKESNSIPREFYFTNDKGKYFVIVFDEKIYYKLSKA